MIRTAHPWRFRGAIISQTVADSLATPYFGIRKNTAPANYTRVRCIVRETPGSSVASSFPSYSTFFPAGRVGLAVTPWPSRCIRPATCAGRLCPPADRSWPDASSKNPPLTRYRRYYGNATAGVTESRRADRSDCGYTSPLQSNWICSVDNSVREEMPATAGYSSFLPFPVRREESSGEEREYRLHKRPCRGLLFPHKHPIDSRLISSCPFLYTLSYRFPDSTSFTRSLFELRYIERAIRRSSRALELSNRGDSATFRAFAAYPSHLRTLRRQTGAPIVP